MLFKNLLDIIVSPAQAFSRIRDKPSILFPLLLVLAGTISVQYAYFTLVDFDFLVDELVEQAAAITAAPEDQLRQAYASQSPRQIAISSALSVAVLFSAIFALYAGWLALMSKLRDDGIRFKHWFSLICWSCIPMLLSVLAGWVVLLSAADAEISLREIGPLQLQNLFGAQDGGSLGGLGNVDLTQLWALALVVAGYRQWTGKNWGSAALIALAPFLVIALIILIV